MVKLRKPEAMHRKLQIMRRKVAKWDGDTQKLRTQVIEGLIEQYNIACAIVRGEQQTEVDESGKQERMTLMKRKEWAKVAQGLAEAIRSATDSFDAAKMDRDMELLQKMILECKKRLSSQTVKPQGELPNETKAKANTLGPVPTVCSTRKNPVAN